MSRVYEFVTQTGTKPKLRWRVDLESEQIQILALGVFAPEPPDLKVAVFHLAGLLLAEREEPKAQAEETEGDRAYVDLIDFKTSVLDALGMPTEFGVESAVRRIRNLKTFASRPDKDEAEAAEADADLVRVDHTRFSALRDFRLGVLDMLNVPQDPHKLDSGDELEAVCKVVGELIGQRQQAEHDSLRLRDELQDAKRYIKQAVLMLGGKPDETFFEAVQRLTAAAETTRKFVETGKAAPALFPFEEGVDHQVSHRRLIEFYCDVTAALNIPYVEPPRFAEGEAYTLAVEAIQQMKADLESGWHTFRTIVARALDLAEDASEGQVTDAIEELQESARTTEELKRQVSEALAAKNHLPRADLDDFRHSVFAILGLSGDTRLQDAVDLIRRLHADERMKAQPPKTDEPKFPFVEEVHERLDEDLVAFRKGVFDRLGLPYNFADKDAVELIDHLRAIEAEARPPDYEPDTQNRDEEVERLKSRCVEASHWARLYEEAYELALADLSQVVMRDNGRRFIESALTKTKAVESIRDADKDCVWHGWSPPDRARPEPVDNEDSSIPF